MWRPSYELLREFAQAQLVLCFESRLADLVLLVVMRSAQADRPFVRGLQAEAAVGAVSNMGALDR